MYMSEIDCGCMRKKGMAGLSAAGTGAAVGTAVGSYYGPVGAAVGGAVGGMFDGGGGGGGGDGASAIPSITVTTNTNTQVSPQISPSFVQQDHPVDSPVTTTAVSTPTQTQALPPIPVTGAMPGIDNAPNPYAYPPLAPVAAPLTIFGMNAEYVALGAAALLVAGIAYKKYKQRKKSTRHVS